MSAEEMQMQIHRERMAAQKDILDKLVELDDKLYLILKQLREMRDEDAAEDDQDAGEILH